MPGISSTLKTQLGNYIDVHRDQLIDQVMERSETLDHARTVVSDAQAGNQVAIISTHLDEVVQGFQPEWNAKGTLQAGAEVTTQRRHKINVPIDPDKIVGEWIGHLYDEKKKREDMPITQYIMDKVVAKVDDDRENKMVYKGVHAPTQTGVAGPAQASVDGYGKIIADAQTAGKITPFVLGLPNGNVFEYVETFLSLIPTLFRYKFLKLFMSPDNAYEYQRDKRNTFQYRQEMGELLKIDFSNMQIVGCPSMNGVNTMFATVPGNLIRLIHQNKGADNIDAVLVDYIVKVKADWHEAYGIADFRYFWKNDV